MTRLESEPVTLHLTRGDIRTLLGWWTDAHPNGGAPWDRTLANQLADTLDNT